jgi:pyruvate formate lyase activating enzyme
LTTYGRSSGFCIDPIEKKPLNHFLPGTPVLSFGTAGCNLACKFCQNWDISKSREMQTLADAASPELLASAASQLKCRSIAYTYNDPVIFHEYAIDVAQAAREQGVSSVAVTAGYICPEPRKEFFDHMDAANIDLKAFTERFYHKICGGHLANVLDTLLYLNNETTVWIELTTLLIPGENDSAAEIESMSRWIMDNLGPDIPMHFTAFHPDYRMNEIPATSRHTLAAARKIAKQSGIKFVYTGNVHDSEGGSTWCPSCGSILIERDWYKLGSWRLDAQGCCRSCGEWIPGIFEAEPGDWGPKRQPVRLNH